MSARRTHRRRRDCRQLRAEVGQLRRSRAARRTLNHQRLRCSRVSGRSVTRCTDARAHRADVPMSGWSAPPVPPGGKPRSRDSGFPGSQDGLNELQGRLIGPLQIVDEDYERRFTPGVDTNR